MTNPTQQTMTIKELAEVAGCSVKTIRRIVKKEFPSMIVNGRETRFTKEEAFDVMALLPKQNDLGQPRTKEVKVGQGSIESRIDRLESKFDKLIDLMILRETGKKEEPKPQNLIAAKLEPRDEIRKIINQYTAHAKTSYRQNWNLLYQESYYRLGINFKVRGQRRSKSPLEIAEEMGFIYDLLAIAREIFQLGRT